MSDYNFSFSDIHIGIHTVNECKHCWFPTLTDITWIFSYKKVLFCRFLYTKMMSNIFVGTPTVASIIYKIKTKVILKEHPHFLCVREWLLTSSIWAGHVLKRILQNHFTDEESWGSVWLSQWPKVTELLSKGARIWTFIYLFPRRRIFLLFHTPKIFL